jgi:hypothetical protein
MSDYNSDKSDEEYNGPNNRNVVDRTLNRAFDLLASQRRRYVLAELQSTSDGVASVERLADSLLAHESDSDDRDQVLVALYHRILPRLDDSNVIDFDRRSDTARYHGHKVVDELLEFAAERKE